MTLTFSTFHAILLVENKNSPGTQVTSRVGIGYVVVPPERFELPAPAFVAQCSNPNELRWCIEFVAVAPPSLLAPFTQLHKARAGTRYATWDT